MIPIAGTYPTRAHYKKCLFPVTLQFDPHFVHDQFSLTQFRRQILQKTCDATVHDIPLH